MMKASVDANELKRMIAAELTKGMAAHHVQPEALVILPKPVGWWATLSRNGLRIDEAQLAAISEVGLRLAAGFDLAR
jgi:hypothetical protein